MLRLVAVQPQNDGLSSVARKAAGLGVWHLVEPSGPRSLDAVTSARGCSKTGCQQVAVATLTFVYADSTAVLGPLVRNREPHSYDICQAHANRLTAPRGWDIVRIPNTSPARSAADDDLLAIADLVGRESIGGRAESKSVPTNQIPSVARPQPRPFGSESHPAGRAGFTAVNRNHPRTHLHLVD